jgi:PKD repeat protein
VGTPNPTITPTSDSCTAAVTLVINGEPVANAGQDQVVHQGTLVIFNASNSVSSGSNPIYTWSFIDGTPKILEGMIANYTFNRPGKYTVTLTLQDSLGTDNSTVIITVLSNTKPIAKITLQGITAEQSASVEQSITFSGSESYEPGNGTICSYLWNMGDGIGIGTGQTITYAYALPGTYNVTLTVFDANDNNATTSTIINVVQSSSPSPSYSQQSFSLPPAILAILLLVTITVLVGAIFWLRKRT